jgi:hypothetical protein
LGSFRLRQMDRLTDGQANKQTDGFLVVQEFLA